MRNTATVPPPPTPLAAPVGMTQPGRSMWKGVISFGMLSVPVKMFTAQSPKDLRFNQIHAGCNGRIKHRKVCEVHDTEVDASEILRAFEYSRDAYVTLSDDELDNLPVPSRQTIALDAFVDASAVDPLFYEKSYHVLPEPLGMRPYALLADAMQRAGVLAVARITMRTRESLCTIRAERGRLVLTTLLYADEVRSVEAPPTQLLSEAETQIADALVQALRKPFDPTLYADTYREALTGLIEAKVGGGVLPRNTAAPLQAPASDLMAALRATLEQVRAQQGPPEPEPTPINKARAARRPRKAAGQ